MKYRVVLEVLFNDGTDDKVGIYTYDSEALALQGFYKYMGQYVGGSNVASVNVISKNSNGGIYKNESWINNSVTTTEETTETE